MTLSYQTIYDVLSEEVAGGGDLTVDQAIHVLQGHFGNAYDIPTITVESVLRDFELENEGFITDY